MKKTMMFLGMLSLGLAHAQQYDEKVGINTDTPSATLNVKTKTDSKSPKNLELENQAGDKLVTVLNNGKVGFNTDNPSGRLTIFPSGNTYSDNSIYHNLIRDSFSGGEYGFKRARGTKDALEAVKKGDEIAHINFSAYGSNNRYDNVAIITASVADDDNNGAYGRLDFFLRKKGIGGRQVLRIDNTGYLGLGRAVSTPLAPLHIQTDVEDITREESERGQKDEILISLHYGGQNAITQERRRSISSINYYKKRLHSIDFGLINPAGTTDPFMAFMVAPQNPSSELATVERMRIMHTGNIGMGTTAPTHKLHIKADADPLKLEGLRETTDANAKNLVVVDGVVKVGVATSNANVKLGTGTSKPCNADNAGTINYEEITKDGKKTGVFGFCMKRNDNEYVWAYMVGGTNPFGTSANGANFADGIKD